MSTTSLPERYGRWALVVGASQGLGKAIAEQAAGQGFDVVLLARRGDVLAEVAREIEGTYGVQTRTVAVSVTDESFGSLVAELAGDLDIGLAVYNAAAEPMGPFLDLPVRKHLTALTVNCVGPTLVCHEIGAAMRRRGRGAIVLVASEAALYGTKFLASYGASKAYVLNLAEALWDELRDDGVDVLGYVVGAAATPTYFGTGGTPATDPDEAIEVDDLLETVLNRARNPRTPEEVAARLLTVLDQGPTQFSSPIDERIYRRKAALDRREVVRVMGEQITRGWSD